MVLFATLAFTPTSSLLFTGAWICKNTERYNWTIEQFVSNQLIIENHGPNSLLKKSLGLFLWHEHQLVLQDTLNKCNMSWKVIHVFNKTGLSDHTVVKFDAQNNQSISTDTFEENEIKNMHIHRHNDLYYKIGFQTNIDHILYKRVTKAWCVLSIFPKFYWTE